MNNIFKGFCTGCPTFHYRNETAHRETTCNEQTTCDIGYKMSNYNSSTEGRCIKCESNTINKYNDRNQSCETCLSGYEPNGNQSKCLDINECRTNPCQNGGNCTESSSDPNIAFGTYNCSCLTGFKGDNCTDLIFCKLPTDVETFPAFVSQEPTEYGVEIKGCNPNNTAFAFGKGNNCGCGCLKGYSGPTCDEACPKGYINENWMYVFTYGFDQPSFRNCSHKLQCILPENGAEPEDPYMPADRYTSAYNNYYNYKSNWKNKSETRETIACERGEVSGTTGNCTCDCPQHYSGELCDMADICIGNNNRICKNNGTAPYDTLAAGCQKHCDCNAHWTGPQCTWNTYTCDASQIKDCKDDYGDHAVCQFDYANMSPICKCPTGYGFDGNTCVACNFPTYNNDTSDIGVPCANMTCPVGFGVNTLSTETANTESDCKECVNGTHSPAGQGQCTQNVCGCENGHPAQGGNCTTDKSHICMKCDDGYYLDGDMKCKLKVCTCSGGTATNGTKCNTHNNVYCEQCDDGFHPNPPACELNVCIQPENCPTAANGTACPVHATLVIHDGCSQCIPGKYQNVSGCNDCQAGKFSTVSSSTSCTDWESCTSNYYQSKAPTTSSQRECTACPSGWKQPNDDYNGTICEREVCKCFYGTPPKNCGGDEYKCEKCMDNFKLNNGACIPDETCDVIPANHQYLIQDFCKKV